MIHDDSSFPTLPSQSMGEGEGGGERRACAPTGMS